jgi:hypothetical protein
MAWFEILQGMEGGQSRSWPFAAHPLLVCISEEADI